MNFKMGSMKSLGERLYEVLKERNVERKELEQVISSSHLSEVIAGKKHLSRTKLNSLARRLNLSADELTRDTDWTERPHERKILWCPNQDCPQARWAEVAERDSQDASTRRRTFQNYASFANDDPHGALICCPACGSRLVENPLPVCECGRPSSILGQAHCMGCGKSLVPTYAWRYFVVRPFKATSMIHVEHQFNSSDFLEQVQPSSDGLMVSFVNSADLGDPWDDVQPAVERYQVTRSTFEGSCLPYSDQTILALGKVAGNAE